MGSCGPMASAERRVSMSFHVYRCKKNQGIFIVENDAHADEVSDRLCPTVGDELEKVGVSSEMGEGGKSGLR